MAMVPSFDDLGRQFRNHAEYSGKASFTSSFSPVGPRVSGQTFGIRDESRGWEHFLMNVALRVPTSSDLVLQYMDAGWWNDSGLREGLEAIAERDGNRIAVVDNVGTWTYEMLRDAVERAVHTLQGAGLERDDSVLLVSPNSFDGVVAFLSILRCSAVTVALDRRCGASDVAHAIDMTSPRLAVMPRSSVMSLRLADH